MFVGSSVVPQHLLEIICWCCSHLELKTSCAANLKVAHSWKFVSRCKKKKKRIFLLLTALHTPQQRLTWTLQFASDVAVTLPQLCLSSHCCHKMAACVEKASYSTSRKSHSSCSACPGENRPQVSPCHSLPPLYVVSMFGWQQLLRLLPWSKSASIAGFHPFTSMPALWESDSQTLSELQESISWKWVAWLGSLVWRMEEKYSVFTMRFHR